MAWSWATPWVAHVNDVEEFDGVQNAAGLGSAPLPATLPALSGNALRVEVPDHAYANSGIRAEVLLRSDPATYEREGTTTRYGWSTLLDPDYPRRPRVSSTGKAPYQVIAQWHATANDRFGDDRSPPVSIIIRDGAFLLDRYQVVERDAAWVFEELPAAKIGSITLGEWHHFEVTTRWSSAEDGWVSVVHGTAPRNATLTTATGRTLYPAIDPSKPRGVYFKAGLYRGPRDGTTALPTTDEDPDRVPMGQRLGTTQDGGRIGYVLYHDEFSRTELQGAGGLPGRDQSTHS